MEKEFPHIMHYQGDTECMSHLIKMTNIVIDYRNDFYDGVCNLSTYEIEDEEDFDYISKMDARINKVIDFLENYSVRRN